jgi:Zn-dependent M28 family amino/carboxypeptidase
MTRAWGAGAVFLALLASPAAAEPPALQAQTQTASMLRDKALADPTAYLIVESLTTEVGARPAGSPAAARARDWALAKLKSLGFENVHAEPFAVTAWARGPEAAEVTAPVPQKLQILGLGRSPSTPPGGIEAEIALFHSYEELLAAPPGSLAGKIAVLTAPMARTQDASGYEVASRWRTQGPIEAGKRGAIGFLVRSLSTSDSRLPHTGAMHSGEPAIPAAALGVPDAELLDRLVARGGPVRVRLVLNSTSTPNAPAWNVVGEIKGAERPDEVVIIGGHLDSWDPGQGAIDDGAGVAITTAAAHLISELPRHPKRTIRVVLFGDEELDFSGRAYAQAHAAEAGKITAVGESDLGSDAPYSVALPAGAAAAPALKPLAPVLAPLKIFISPEPARFAGSDFGGLQQAGAPPFFFAQDATHYFDIHHSADDTLDKIDPKALARNVAVWSALVYLLADSDIDLHAPKPVQPATAAPARP